MNNFEKKVIFWLLVLSLITCFNTFKIVYHDKFFEKTIQTVSLVIATQGNILKILEFLADSNIFEQERDYSKVPVPEVYTKEKYRSLGISDW